MKSILLVGVITAIIAGIAIAIQSSFSARVGALIGPIRTGLFTNVFGGTVALLILGATIIIPIGEKGDIPSRAVLLTFLAGFFGVFIIMGISFSFQRTGVTAGSASVILGQLFISTIVDTTGWGGAEPIPLSLNRILGLLVMAIAVYLLLPRN